MEKDTGRVDDGVFAIAITLLILEIRVPELDAVVSDGHLFAALVRLWPSLLAFLFSFFVILVVTFVPFPTAVVARYLGTPAERAAVAFYCATFVCISVAYNVLLVSVAYGRRLVRPEVSDEVLARVRRAYGMSPAIYGVSVVLALWSASAGLLLCASLWLVWTRLCYRSARPGEEADARSAA
jgi:uncharacterized membrane protein